MIKPLGNEYPGFYYDGAVSRRHEGRLTLEERGLRVELEDRCLLWPYGECELVSDGFHGEPARVERRGSFGEAVATMDRQFVTALGQYNQAVVARAWWDLRLEGWASMLQSGAGVLLLGAGLYYFGLGLIAELGAMVAPRSVETRMGESTVKLLAPESSRCTDKEAIQLLGRVEKQLFSAVKADYPFRVIYARMGMVNAFAAPGGMIVVSEELLRKSVSEDEYAAVIAHEIQHVLHRDSMRAMARQLGGSMLLAMLSVDPSSNAFFLNQSSAVLELSFSRGAETLADLGAVRLLRKVGRDPEGLIRFLEGLEEGRLGNDPMLKYLLTHPLTAERVAALRKEIGPGRGGRKLLTNGEWLRAQRVCEI
jgi:beta-barrel assembly-enhancing protease